jgi:hypothetical protein
VVCAALDKAAASPNPAKRIEKQVRRMVHLLGQNKGDILKESHRGWVERRHRMLVWSVHKKRTQCVLFCLANNRFIVCE